MLDIPSSRNAAKAQGVKYYFTGERCLRGHLAKRFTSIGKCTLCHVEIERQRRAENPQRHRDTVKRYMTRNPGVAAERARAWRAANPEKKIAYARKWLQENLEGHRQRQRLRYLRTWAAKSLPAERALMRAIYVEARRLTKETGIRHHVDHIIPLSRGGPHLPHNLQILTDVENLRKGAAIPEGFAAPWPIRNKRIA